jgi:hypothetical protein
VERAAIEVQTIAIDASKAEYIFRVHNVLPRDVDEALRNSPRYFVRSRPAGLYNMIGPNRSGRFLVVGLAHVAGTEWRLITAYWNDDGRARRAYGEKDG